MDPVIEIKVCEDMEFVRHCILTIWDSMCEDGADKEAYEPDPKETWLEATVDGRRAGVWRLHGFSASVLQVHVNILPEFRKIHTVEIGVEFHKWIQENAPNQYKTFLALIPDCYPNVLSYAVKQGWCSVGYVPAGFKRNNQYHDLIMLSLARAIKEENGQCLPQ